MSNIIVEEGYPADFHLGISLIFWLVYIFITLTLAIVLFSQARKTPLLNRKELYVGSSVFSFFGLGLAFILIQIGVFFPVFFIISLSIANLFTIGSLIVFVYLWEKNSINLKYIPTLWMVFVFSLALINLIHLLITGRYVFMYFILITTIFNTIGVFFLIILLLIFTKRVMGVLRIKGIICIIAVICIAFGAAIDHPPFVTIYPSFLAILSPIIFIIGSVTWYFAMKGICDGITSYYNQAQICTIHRGKVSKDTHIYFCPNCNTSYCQKCYEQVIKKEGCWNCQEGIEPEEEDKKKREAIFNKKDFQKKKVNKVKPNEKIN